MNATSALFRGTRIGSALDAFFNHYEAAQPNSPDRGYVPAFVRDARFDASSYTRWELMRKIRDFDRNTWIVPKLKEVYTKYTVGAGLPVIPASSSTDWNKYALEEYLLWCEQPCRDALHTMGTVHQLMAGTEHVEGGIFVLKTRVKNAGQPSRPAIQLIEGHRVSSPGQGFSLDQSANQIDGVEVDANGRPVGYWVREDIFDIGGNVQEWTFRRAGTEMLHVFEPRRVGMYREITPYHAVLNSLQDLNELEELEMERAKQNSENAYFFKTKTGEFRSSDKTRERFRSDGPVPNQNPKDDDLAKRVNMFRRVLGAKAVAIKTDEEVLQQENKNPSAATQWYWRYKVGQIGSTVGIPMILIMPESMQGTVSRAVLDDANIFFRSKFKLFAHAAKDIYRYWAGWARNNLPTMVNAPDDWWKCRVNPPRACNVDVGYTSDAKIAEWSAGITTLDIIAAADGRSAEELLSLKAHDVGRCKQIAAEISKEMGVEIKPEEIMGDLAEIAKNLAAAQASRQTQQDPEEVPA